MTEPDNETTRRTARLLMCWQMLCGLVLLVTTWKLWWPATAFPRIPWFSWGLWIPVWIDGAACLVLVVGLVSLLWDGLRHVVAEPAGKSSDTSVCAEPPAKPSWRIFRVSERQCHPGLWVVLFSLGMLVLLDQHRLQPWAWQLLLWVMVFLGDSSRLANRLRWLVLSIYVWSGVSKLDAAFPEAHGRLLLDGLTRACGIETRFWSPETLNFLPRLFPWGELTVAGLLTAGLLLTRRTSSASCDLATTPEASWRLNPTDALQSSAERRGASRGDSCVVGKLLLTTGCWLAILMHLVLLLTLGPLGLNHEPGVLVWNLFFIGQTWLLFGGCASQSTGCVNRQGGAPSREGVVYDFREGCVSLVLRLAIVMPGTSLFGFWDHWPSWSVYSSRPQIVSLWLEGVEPGLLPADLQSCLGEPLPLETRRLLNLDAWSYRMLNCPPYPQGRYRLAMAREVILRHDLEPLAMIEYQSSPDWWTGTRHEYRFDLAGLNEFLGRYIVNTQAR